VTFSLSMLGMALTWRKRKRVRNYRYWTALFVAGFLLCATILGFTVNEKFLEGGWVTLAVTGALVLLCYAVRAHYNQVSAALSRLYSELGTLGKSLPPDTPAPGEPDPEQPTAAALVASYGGLRIPTLLSILRVFPGHFRNVVFLSVGVVDSGAFKGEDEVDRLRLGTQETLRKYVELARGLGVASTGRMALGTDAVEEAEKLC